MFREGGGIVRGRVEQFSVTRGRRDSKEKVEQFSVF